jgi:uncharacterized protein (DUF885 family)
MTVRQLADEQLDVHCQAEPIEATITGVRGYEHLLPDLSEEGQAALRDRAAGIAARAAAIDPSTLDSEDRVTRAVTEALALARVDFVEAREIEYAITGLFVSPPAQLLTMLPLVTFPDSERGQAFIERLTAIPHFLATAANRHRGGIAAGRLPVRRLVQATIDLIDRYLGESVDPLLRQELPTPTLIKERERVLADLVRPAFVNYREVLATELLEHGRPDDRIGVGWLPEGDTIYTRLSRVHTTTNRTPDELHQTGLDLIAALRDEYADLGQKVFGTTDQQEIFRRMTTDPDLRWKDADELLAAAADAVTRAEAAAPHWFGRLPSQPCKVEPVPLAEAPTAPAAYYVWPSIDGSRPGIYFANTDRAEQRDRFVSEAVAYHEAVPGHHFQLTISQELTHLPMLRRLSPVNAFAEGWGLYTERLAEEMGLYSSDIDRLGMLSMDSLRAGRLVVDTGIHAKGWSRQQAIDYLRVNSPLAALEIANEIDRYTAYAGQALSYMVGRLEIQRLRAKAESALGERFDIRAFHDLVLEGGSLPLTVLDGVVTGWITSA